MLSAACGLAVYTPIRHLLTASDVSLDHRDDYFADNVASNPKVLEQANKYRGGLLGSLANVTTAGSIGSVLPDVGVPATYNTRQPYHPPSAIPRPGDGRH